MGKIVSDADVFGTGTIVSDEEVFGPAPATSPQRRASDKNVPSFRQGKPESVWDTITSVFSRNPAEDSARAANALVNSELLGIAPSVAYRYNDEISQQLIDNVPTEKIEARPQGMTGAAKAGARDSIAGIVANRGLDGTYQPQGILQEIAFGLGQMAADLPVMIAGGAVGMGGGPVGSMAGAFALPAGLRKVLVDRYKNGEVVDFADFRDRAIGAMKETAKGGVVGAITSVSGGLGAKVGYKVASEIAAMTVAGKLVEGEVPTAKDFVVAAGTLGAFHGAMKLGGLAKVEGPKVQESLEKVYVESGMKPNDVVTEIKNRTPDADMELPAGAQIELPLEQVVARVGSDAKAIVEPGASSGVGAEKPGSKGLYNYAIDSQRQKAGLEPIERPMRDVEPKSWDQAKADVDAGKVEPIKIAREVIEKPRVLSDAEHNAMLYESMKLEAQHAKVEAELDIARKAGDKITEENLVERRRNIENNMDVIDRAAKASGSEWGKAGQARQNMIDQDYSLSGMIRKARQEKGSELTERERAKYEALSKELEDANKKIADYEARKVMGTLPNRAERRAAKLEQLNAEYESLVKSFNLAIGGPEKLNAGFDPVTGSILLAKIAKNRIKAGAVGLDGALETISKDLEAKGISTSPAEIRQSIANLRRLDTYKTRMKGDIAKKEAKIEAGDFSKPEKAPELELDAEAKQLRYERELVIRKYDKALWEDQVANLEGMDKLKYRAVEASTFVRAIKTSMDLSAVFRQGAMIALGSPVIGIKGFKPMLKSLASDKGQFEFEQSLAKYPHYELAKKSKLFLADHDYKLNGREENFMSSVAEKVPGVVASQRAYTSYLNYIRMEKFQQLVRDLPAVEGKVNPGEAKAIANIINVFTGRGKIGFKGEAPGAVLNTALFSPRLVASRFNAIALQPLYSPGSTITTAKIAAKQYARFFGGLLTIYGLGMMAGGEVSFETTSSDYGKIRFGNTTVDPMAGLSQVSVFLGRVAFGETTNKNGVTTPIRGPFVKYGGTDVPTLAGRFLKSKLAPIPGTVLEQLSGKNYNGEPIDATDIPAALFMPLSFKDIYESMVEQGIEGGTALALLSIFGMGIQNQKQNVK